MVMPGDRPKPSILLPTLKCKVSKSSSKQASPDPDTLDRDVLVNVAHNLGRVHVAGVLGIR